MFFLPALAAAAAGGSAGAAGGGLLAGLGLTAAKGAAGTAGSSMMGGLFGRDEPEEPDKKVPYNPIYRMQSPQMYRMGSSQFTSSGLGRGGGFNDSIMQILGA